MVLYPYQPPEQGHVGKEINETSEEAAESRQFCQEHTGVVVLEEVIVAA